MNPLDCSVINEDMQYIYTSLKGILPDSGTFLITGSSGMIAQYCVLFLCYMNEIQGRKYRIIASTRGADRIKEIYGGLCDKDYFITREQDLDIPLEHKDKAEYIIHAAGISNPSLFSSVPVEVASANALGTYYLLKGAIAGGVEGMVFLSTSTIYGKSDGGIIRENDYWGVNPIDAYSCYTESNRMGETWCYSFFREYGLPCKIIRLCNTFGPTMDIINDTRAFASFMGNIVQNEDIVIYSDGRDKRHYLYLADAIKGLFIVLIRGQGGEAYNLVDSRIFFSILEFAELMVKLKPDRSLKVKRMKREKGDGYLVNPTNRANYLSDDKIKKLGFKAEINIEKGLERTLRGIEELKC